MKAGLLNSRVTVEAKRPARDETGATVNEWQPLAELWADVRHTSGAEAIKGDSVAGVVKASIRVRYRADISADMRVRLSGGAVYEIRAVLPDARRVFVDLVCERVSNAAA